MAQNQIAIQNSLAAGELSPALYGRMDLEKWKSGLSTCRNFFSSYRGGIVSRAGLAYVGTCKQPGSGLPPRDIPFQFSLNQGYVLEFGDVYMRIKTDGAYVTESPETVTSVSSAAVFTVPGHGYSTGDWVYDIGNTGFNGLTWIVHTVPTVDTFTITDLFGNVISSATVSSGGTVSRIYTVVSPYAVADLQYLKFTQSADVMTLTCVNPVTGTEYPPYDLVRNGNTDWEFTQETFTAIITPPVTVTVTAESSTTPDTWYSYVVTTVSSTGEESIASTPASVENNDISIDAGSNTISWSSVIGATSYNIYKSTPSYSTDVPLGVSYGYMATAFGLSTVDTNIEPDFTAVPPTHQDPFARGVISEVLVTAPGINYTQATIGYTVTTGTGSGFEGTPLVDGTGAFSGFLIQAAGEGYLPGDTIAITDSGSGSGATAALSIGPQAGTYPSVPAYFQQRRVYAGSLNSPDTYWMSKPGLFSNMDFSIPVQASDAIIGTPWAQQVNGIQFLVPMPGGLVVLTGKGAWQVNGGSSAAITPSTQTATPQAYNGCHNFVPPIPINYDILYVQSKGSIIRDLSYNFFVNIYTGTDLTILSNHLFIDEQIVQWAWAEEPYKLLWVVRSDGTALSLTYLKEQDVYAWTRHDTNGLIQGVCSVTEPPVDAVYFIVRRYVQNGWRYYSERMNDRIWNNVEDSFCVDSGLTYPDSFPNATLQVSAATGTVTMTASTSVFNSGQVGDIVRVGGGKITVTGYTSGTELTGLVTEPIVRTVPDDPNEMPIPAGEGVWSIAVPVSSVSGLNHLEGLLVSVLADGSVSPSQIVTNGRVTLTEPASVITIGLPYVCQAQTLYLDHPSQDGSTIQNRRKNISAVGLRVYQSRGLTIGADQIDQSTQQNLAAPPWVNMVEIKERTAFVTAGTAIPLYTGDYYQAVTSSWKLEGQIAIQQLYPLPANILSTVAYYSVGDDK